MQYYNGATWVIEERYALKMTYLKAQEILESLQLQTKKKMIVGDFIMREI
jgi:hypothetical protein